MSFRFCLSAGMFCSLLTSPAIGQRDLKNIPSPDPELERATFRLPEGFEVNLFAGDPQLPKPIQMNFDTEGRLWIATSEVYPHIEPGKPARDRIIVLEDTDHDGVADRNTVFAEGLLIPTGVAPGDGGAYVANSTELIHFKDTDGDLKADSRDIILSGFGTEDTHHILHTLRWGPAGHLYFNQSIYIHSHIETPWGVRRLNAGGIWQFRPETRELGVLMKGLVNSWGHIVDRYGQSFATDGAGGEGINYVVPGGYYLTAANAPKLMHGLNPGSPKHCGLEIIETPSLPPEWQGSVLTNDFRGHRVCRFQLTEDRSGYVSREHQEVIASDHVAFRPIDVRIGPDGAIYIADWYNPIIQHGEVDFRDPRRDHTHGRIWRVTWKGSKSPRVESPKSATTVKLLDRLKSANRLERHTARRELKERGSEIEPALDKWLASIPVTAATEHLRLEALWCFQSLRIMNGELLQQLLKAADGRVRAAAVRVLSHWKYQLPNSDTMLTTAVTDEHPRVRLEAVRAISFSPLQNSERQTAEMQLSDDPSARQTLANRIADPDQVTTALQVLNQSTDRFLDYGLFLTIRELASSWLPKFRSGELTFGGDINKLTTAFSAVGQAPPADVLIDRVYDDQTTAATRPKLVDIISRSANSQQFGQLADVASQRQDAASLVQLSQQSRSRNLRGVFGNALETATTSQDTGVRSAALVLAGQWHAEGYANLLKSTVTSTTDPESVRGAALQGIRLSDDATLHPVMDEFAQQPLNPPALRKQAAAFLTDVDLKAGVIAAVDLMSSLEPQHRASDLTRSFLVKRTGHAALTDNLKTAKLPAETAREMLQIVRESGRTIPDLEQAIILAGNVSSRASMSTEDIGRILKQAEGMSSAAEGERVFRREKLGCLKCHAIGGAGGLVGPDILSLGASAQPDYILQSLLQPNAKVKENYHTVVVETDSGRIVSGIQVQESDQELVLRSAENELIRIPKKTIEEKINGVSLMPEGLVDTLTDSDLAALVRFLSELGRTKDYTLQRGRQLRSWQTMKATPEAHHILRRTRMATAAEARPEFQWVARYSQVNGRLPLNAIPVVVPQNPSRQGFAFARAVLAAETAGNIVLSIGDTSGLELLIDGQPVPVEERVQVSVTPGETTLTLIVNTAVRESPLDITIQDDGTTAVVTPVNL